MIPHFLLRDLAIATDAPHPKPHRHNPMLYNVVIAIAFVIFDVSGFREHLLSMQTQIHVLPPVACGVLLRCVA